MQEATPKILSKHEFNEVRQWIYRNVRQLELALWQYANAFAISENWWRSFHAIWKMCFLRNFDRLEAN